MDGETARFLFGPRFSALVTDTEVRDGRLFRRKEGELLKIRIYLQTWKPVEECTKRESEKDFGYLASERKEEEQC